MGAQTADGLRDAENDLVETRLIELREDPDILGDRSYDLLYLQAIHRPLFQDVLRVRSTDTTSSKTVAYLYDYANFAHSFREGNGRSTREFFDILLSERGLGFDWERTDLAELHDACHAARAQSELGGLVAMFDF